MTADAPAVLTDTTWTIRHPEGDDDTVRAAYYVIDADSRWVQFKNPEHKSMYACPEWNISAIVRGHAEQ